jgi:hypothetical protein
MCAAHFPAFAAPALAQQQAEPTRVQPQRAQHAEPTPSNRLPRARALSPQRLQLLPAPRQRAPSRRVSRDVHIVGADAGVFSAPVALINEEGVQWAGPAWVDSTRMETHPRAVVVGTHLPATILPPPRADSGPSCVVGTSGQERIAGWLVAIDEVRLAVRHPALGIFTVDLRDVTRLWFDPESADAPTPSPETGRPAVILANGDALVGQFVFDEDGVTADTALGTISAPMSRIRGVHFGVRPSQATPARIVLADGSHIAVARISGALGRAGDIAVALTGGREHAVASRSIVAWLGPGTLAAPLESRLVNAGPRMFILPPESEHSGVVLGRLRAPRSPWTDARVSLWLDREPIWAQRLDESSPAATFTAPLTASGLQLHIGAGPSGLAHAIARLTGLTLTWPADLERDQADSIEDQAPR